MSSQLLHLKHKVARFGKIRYVTIVKDKTTGRSKGTGFVQFKTRDSAAQAVKEGLAPEQDKARSKKKKKRKKEKQNLLSKPSNIELQGRCIFVSYALERGEVTSLQQTRDGEKRNMHLAEVGLEQQQHHGKAEVTRRETAMQQKREKLNNKNFSVSSTRLVVKNLPRSLDEKELKAIFSTRARALRKSGAAELVFKQAKIFQTKVVRSTEAERKNRSNSKRFGFVEFREHADAMNCLEFFNEHDLQDGHRASVEFALEDAQKVNARIQRNKRQLMMNQAAQKEGAKTEEKKKKTKKKPGMKKRKRLKKSKGRPRKKRRNGP